MIHLGRWSILIVGSALVIAPLLEARSCTSNGDVIGSYGWVGSRSPQFVPSPPAEPPATPVTPMAGSSTPIGALAAGAANSASFAAVGRVFLDGNGGIYASPNATSPILQVGKYVVNTDCTISATITDTFTPPVDPFLPAIQASVKLEGSIVWGGNELNLVQVGGPGGTTLTLTKTRQFNGCTNDIVGGSYGLSATGLSTAPAVEDAAPVTTPFTLYARVAADGSGKFVPDALAVQSPLAARQMTGTYAVNADCTGTGTLVGADNKSRKISFVLVTSGLASNNASQAFVFAFTDTGVVGAGQGQQQ